MPSESVGREDSRPRVEMQQKQCSNAASLDPAAKMHLRSAALEASKRVREERILTDEYRRFLGTREQLPKTEDCNCNCNYFREEREDDKVMTGNGSSSSYNESHSKLRVYKALYR